MPEELTEEIWITPEMPVGIRFRHIGVVDLDEFYRWLNRWFEFNGYAKANEDLEDFYMEKTSPTYREIQFRWKGKNKKTPYFTYVIEVIALLIGVTDVEVQQGDRKVKLQKGDFEFRLGAYLLKTPTTGNQLLRWVYENFILRNEIETHKDEKFYKLHGEIREYFEHYIT
jgi:hypothetical protein